MDTTEKVKEIIIDQLGVTEDEAKPESLLIDDLGADSLDLYEILMYLEEEFDIEIPDEKADKIKTVGEIIDYIESRLKKVDE